MHDNDTDQDLAHAGCSEGALGVLLSSPPTVELDTSAGHTASQQPSGTKSDVVVGRPSTPLAAPWRELQPWFAEPPSAGAADTQVFQPTAGPATSRLTSMRACLGSASNVQDTVADMTTLQEETPILGEAGDTWADLNASFDTKSEDHYPTAVPPMSTAVATGEAGSQFDFPNDGRIPAENSDSTTHGDPVPYYVDLHADDKIGLIPLAERSFRGKLDTGSDVNLLATSIVERMRLIDFMKPVDEHYRIRGLSRSPVPVRGQLIITVDVYYKLIKFRCRPVWNVVDDEYTGGSFDALVGLPVINKSEDLGVIVFASQAFENTSSGAASAGRIEAQIEIENNLQDPSNTTGPTG